jgi:hypothetical protein
MTFKELKRLAREKSISHCWTCKVITMSMEQSPEFRRILRKPKVDCPHRDSDEASSRPCIIFPSDQFYYYPVCLRVCKRFLSCRLPHKTCMNFSSSSNHDTLVLISLCF